MECQNHFYFNSEQMGSMRSFVFFFGTTMRSFVIILKKKTFERTLYLFDKEI